MLCDFIAPLPFPWRSVCISPWPRCKLRRQTLPLMSPVFSHLLPLRQAVACFCFIHLGCFFFPFTSLRWCQVYLFRSIYEAMEQNCQGSFMVYWPANLALCRFWKKGLDLVFALTAFFKMSIRACVSVWVQATLDCTKATLLAKTWIQQNKQNSTL